MNNCLSIYTRSDLNKTKKETMKKTISLIHGWIHGSTCSRKQQMHNIWIFTAVFSNMTNHSFNFFVSFSINDWKNKRWKFKYLPFLRRNTELYLLLSTHREWDSFCRFFANAVYSGYDRGARCLSTVPY